MLLTSHQRSLCNSGNVLFLILIAVALFAALSYAVTNSSRGGSSASKETTAIAASQIIQYATSLEKAMLRMKLINKCRDEEISFETPELTGYTNNNSPDDDSCHLFELAGGEAPYVAPNADWLDETYSAQPRYGEIFFPRLLCVRGAGYVEGGQDCWTVDSATDLIMFIPYLKREICVQINQKLGLYTTPEDPPQATNNLWDSFGGPEFRGDYTAGRTLNTSLTDKNKQSFGGCFEGGDGLIPSAGTYHYYQVLLVR